MNVIHHLWATGPQDPDSFGGLMINPHVPEIRRFKDPPFDLPVLAEIYASDFIAGKYAECGDYAMLLYMTLFVSDYKARLVAASDHIYVEVTIDDQAYVLDAMHNLVFFSKNEEFLKQGNSNKGPYLLFPLRGSNPLDHSTYRAKRGQRRVFYVMTCGRMKPRKVLNPKPLNKAIEWLSLNKVPFEAC